MLRYKPLKGSCEGCLMPFAKDAMDTDRKHSSYCSYCFSDGKLTYEGDSVKEFNQAMTQAIIARGESPLKARFFAFMAGFAPRWRKK